MNPQLIQAGLQIGGALSAGSAKRAAAKANAAILAAQAAAENQVRTGKNIAAAAQGNLSRVLQSMNNQRRARAAGENVARAGAMLAKTQQAQTANSFAERVRAAEEAGALTAEAAFRGVVGGAVETMAATAELRQAAVQELSTRQSRERSYEIGRGAGEFAYSGIAGQDSSPIIDNRDVGMSVARPAQVQGSALTDVLNSGADFGAILRAASDAGQKAWNWMKPQSATRNLQPGGYGDNPFDLR